jgi:hypothetical protein
MSSLQPLEGVAVPAEIKLANEEHGHGFLARWGAPYLNWGDQIDKRRIFGNMKKGCGFLHMNPPGRLDWVRRTLRSGNSVALACRHSLLRNDLCICI